MDSFLHDLKYGVRMLLKNPGFTAIAVLTLALGIGANTAIFTVVNGVLLRPLAFRDPSRIMLVVERNSMFPTITTSYQNYKDWRDQSHSFESMEASCFTNLTLTGLGEPERFKAPLRRLPAFFRFSASLPSSAARFLAEEDRAGGPPVAMISYSLWQRRFGGSARLARQDDHSRLAALHSDRRSASGLSVSSARRHFRSLRTVGENSSRRSRLASRNHSHCALETGRPASNKPAPK